VNGGGRFHELPGNAILLNGGLKDGKDASGDWRSRVKRRRRGLAFGEDVLWNFAEFAHDAEQESTFSA